MRVCICVNKQLKSGGSKEKAIESKFTLSAYSRTQSTNTDKEQIVENYISLFGF